jgi:hypothetical protein
MYLEYLPNIFVVLLLFAIALIIICGHPPRNPLEF